MMRGVLTGLLAIGISIPAFWALKFLLRHKAPDAETVLIGAVGAIAGLPIWLALVGVCLRFFHLWPFSN